MAKSGVVGLCALIVMLSLGVSAVAAVRPDADTVAAVFPPWWARRAVVVAAARAGEIVQLGWAPTVVVVRSGAKRLGARLTAEGAMLILDPRLALGCSTPKEV